MNAIEMILRCHPQPKLPDEEIRLLLSQEGLLRGNESVTWPTAPSLEPESEVRAVIPLPEEDVHV